MKLVQHNPPSNGKGVPNLFFCCPTDNKGPCHSHACDGRSSCLLQLQNKHKTKDGHEAKYQDHFRCTITCGYCGKHRHYEGRVRKAQDSGRGKEKAGCRR